MPSLREVVAAIVGDGTEPAFLPFRIEQMARTIRAYVESEVSAPKRSDMRDRLEEFSRAIRRVKDGLEDPAIEAFIGYDYAGSADGSRFFLVVLDTIVDRSSALTNKLSGRGGSGPAYPRDADEAISSHQLCAWTVIEGIKRARGLAAVAADNSDAWHAANSLYQFSGGQGLGVWKDGGYVRQPSGWREHIIEVKAIEKENSPRGAELRFMADGYSAISPAQIDAGAGLPGQD